MKILRIISLKKTEEMLVMNLKDIKSQFPIFKSNKNLIYFDTANSAQKPIQVIDALEDFYKNHYANIGTSCLWSCSKSNSRF